MAKLLSLTFLLYTNLEKLLQFPQLYLTKHQFAGYPHTHHDNFSWSKARLMREIFPVRYKIMNSQKKKQVHRCNKLFCEAREGTLLTGNGTRIIVSDHQLWMVLGNQRMWKFLYMYTFFNLFLTQPDTTWHRNVASKSHTQMSLTWVSAAHYSCPQVLKDKFTTQEVSFLLGARWLRRQSWAAQV